MKITIYEWIFDKQTKKLHLRNMAKNIKVKYMGSMDNYFCKYKNVIIPMKLDYICEFKTTFKLQRVFNVINWENSFVPFAIFEVKFDQIDNIVSKPDKLTEKIKGQLEEVKVLREKLDKWKKYKEANKEDKKLVKGADLQINLLTKKIMEIQPPKEYIIKACAMPMSIRAWYIQHLKRLKDKHSGFMEKYGTVLSLILFACFGIGLTYVVLTYGGKINVETMNALKSSIAEGIKAGMNQKVTSTTLQVIAP